MEFLPFRDPGYTTALNCNRILREALTGIAMRKKGLTQKQYLSPVTSDDGTEWQDSILRPNLAQN